MGDIYGQLLLIHLTRNSSGRVSAISRKELGDTASPTALIALSPSSRLLYLASRFGDSQLIRLPTSLHPSTADKTGEGEDAMDVEQEADGLDLVQTFASLAPILDAVVVNGEGGGAVSHLSLLRLCPTVDVAGGRRRDRLLTYFLSSFELIGVFSRHHCNSPTLSPALELTRADLYESFVKASE